MMTNNNTRQVLAFVRDRESMSKEDIAKLFAPENVKATMRKLIELKRDIEAQFVAHEARLADMRAEVATAERNGNQVRLEVGKDPKTDEPIYEWFEPAIALDTFIGKELRWKVRTLRFSYLIEAAIDETQDAMKEIDDLRLKTLINAVEVHKKEMEGDAEEIDQDLYGVAERLKTFTA